MWNFKNAKNFIDHNNEHLPWLRDNKRECLISYYYPSILHYVIGKPYLKDNNKFYYDKWWEYTKKTGYYDEIYKYANSY